MKRTSIFFATALLVAGLQFAHAQGVRIGERAWYTIRGGLFVGLNQSFHNGSVPLLPTQENSYFGDAGSTNLIFGVHGEKAVTRYVVLGVRVAFDQMSGEVEGNFTEPYRIADDNGAVYTVSRDHAADYTLKYLSFGFYSKLYPMGGPGFFVLGGANLGALLKGDFAHTATIREPDWARGSVSATQGGEIPDANNLRYALQLGLGYDFYYRYGFVTPMVSYEFGLNPVSSAKYADSWTVNNLRLLIDLTFPIP
jgi:hypothetical protein